MFFLNNLVWLSRFIGGYLLLTIFATIRFLVSLFTDSEADFDGQTISTTIDRSEIWEAETPQIFNFKKLYNAYDLHKNDISLLTDESSLFDELDDQIIFYETTSKNIKITYKEDLKLAEYLLRTIED